MVPVGEWFQCLGCAAEGQQLLCRDVCWWLESVSVWRSPSLCINGAEIPRLVDDTGSPWDIVFGFGKGLEF